MKKPFEEVTEKEYYKLCEKVQKQGEQLEELRYKLLCIRTENASLKKTNKRWQEIQSDNKSLEKITDSLRKKLAKYELKPNNYGVTQSI